MLPQSWYRQDAVTLAQGLLGCELVYLSAEGEVGGLIIETEAYTQDDAASHSFRGCTHRNAVMFGPPGHLYVYFTYGMHYCCNVVSGAKGDGEAVLIRALAPTRGLKLMERRRTIQQKSNLCSGPAKLVQALGLTAAHNGASLTTKRLHIVPRRTVPAIAHTPRIGISRAIELPRRFIIVGQTSTRT